MKIKNTTGGVIIIQDLPGPQTGVSLALPPGAEIAIFDEDADKSSQLGSLINAGIITITGTEEPNAGFPSSSQPAVIIGAGGARLSVTTPAAAGQVLTATSATTCDWQAVPGGSVPDASTTIKGVTKLSVAPVLANSPIAAGDNDPRMSDSRAPLGAASGDLGGSYPAPSVLKLNGVTLSGTPSSGQVLTATSSSAASWQAATGGSLTGSGTTGKLSKWTSASVLGDSIVSETGSVATVTGTLNATAGLQIGGVAIASSNLSDSASLIKTSTSLGGDLSGNLPNATVAKLQSYAVSATPPTNGQVLKYSTATWAGASLSSADLSNDAALIKTSTSLGGDLSGNLPNATVAKVNGIAVSGTPSSGQALVATSASAATWQTIAGSTPDASATVKGVTKLSVAPALATNPVAAGDNDPRMSDGRAPVGSASGDLSGTYPAPAVAKINGVTIASNPSASGQVLRYNGTQWAGAALASTDLSDSAALIKTSTSLGGDLSGNLPNASVAKINGIALSGTPSTGQVLTATSASAANWQTPASGGSSPTTLYNHVSLYEAVTTSGQTVWVKSAASVRANISWSRTTTVLTITDAAHGRSNGEFVIVRNTNVDYQTGTVTFIDANTFSIVCANSGGASGSSGAYSMGFTYAHNAAAGSITSGTLTAPAGANVQLQSLRVYLAANTRSTTTYDVILPASATNGAGGDSSEDDLYVPLTSVRQQSSGPTVTMTAVGFTLTKAVGGNFADFQLASLGAATTPINIQMSF